ncbi:MAG: AAA family ATPase [Christensenellaceae bacterium]|nr:AAA family ATPase [Christensenellaceae bacterium]
MIKRWLPLFCAGAMMITLLVFAFQIKSESGENAGAQAMSLAGAAGLGAGALHQRKRQKEEENYQSLLRPEGVARFCDVAGNDEALNDLAQLVDYLKNPKAYDEAGARMPRGVLLYGPPGTGKTLLARAVAGEAGVPFLTRTGSDFVQMYAGVGAKRVRELFKAAKEYDKSVVFIDEIDALGKRRGAGDENAEREQTLNALLSEMNGFSAQNRVLVIAATNRPDVLDEALLRPGRFDRRIEVGLPDLNAREKILRLLLGKIGSAACPLELAKKTAGFSGAGLESLVNEAAILSASSGQRVGEPALEQAYIEALAGKTKFDSALDPFGKRQVAAHEAGHALASRLLLPEEKIIRVSVLPSVRGAGGYVARQPSEGLPTRRSVLGSIGVALAGRAAEELFFGKEGISAGAANDLRRVAQIVRKLVGEYALEPGFGLLVDRKLDEDRLNAVLEREYDRILGRLGDHFDILSRLTELLIEREQIGCEETESFFSSAFHAQKSEKQELLATDKSS